MVLIIYDLLSKMNLSIAPDYSSKLFLSTLNKLFKN